MSQSRGEGNDRLDGDAGNDELHAGGAYDSLNGVMGVDELERVRARDWADGGKGADRCSVFVSRRCDGYIPVLNSRARRGSSPKMRTAAGR